MLSKECLEEFKLECELRRLSPRTIKGYYNNTMQFLVYAEQHQKTVMLEAIRPQHIKQYIQYLLQKKLYLSCILQSRY